MKGISSGWRNRNKNYRQICGTDYTGRQSCFVKGNTFKVSDKIKRGDFKLTKIDTDNQNRMSDIPFRVTCKGTGESHIIKTDENGYFSSESSWNAHSKNTNGGGAYDGLWFSSTDGSARSMTRLEQCLMVITHLRSFPVTTTGEKSSTRGRVLYQKRQGYS